MTKKPTETTEPKRVEFWVRLNENGTYGRVLLEEDPSRCSQVMGTYVQVKLVRVER